MLCQHDASALQTGQASRARMLFGTGAPAGMERIRLAVADGLRRSGFTAVAVTEGRPALAVCGTRPLDLSGRLDP